MLALLIRSPPAVFYAQEFHRAQRPIYQTQALSIFGVSPGRVCCALKKTSNRIAIAFACNVYQKQRVV
jgi:hypothetical protein